MKKFILFGSIAIVALWIAFIYIMYERHQVAQQLEAEKILVTDSTLPTDRTILFYGKECPHCARVKDFLLAHQTIEEKINLEEQEVYHNRKNLNLLARAAKKCGFDTQTLSVPFVWDGSKCIRGEKDVLNYFMGIYEKPETISH